MKKGLCLIMGFVTLIFAGFAYSLTIPIYLLNHNGHGKCIGSVKAEDTIYGVLLTPALHDLPPGMHGFQVHQNPLCVNYGMAAGGHFDPEKTDEHKGPYNGSGHLGDLPALFVDDDGRAKMPMVAPRLKLADIAGRSLIIHEGEDNYADFPERQGGEGGRIACGVIGYPH